MNWTPAQVVKDAQRTSIIIAINGLGPHTAIANRNSRILDLFFMVDFFDGVFEVPYDNIKAIDVFVNWLWTPDASDVLEIKNRRVIRAPVRKIEAVPPTKSYVKVIWEAKESSRIIYGWKR